LNYLEKPEGDAKERTLACINLPEARRGFMEFPDLTLPEHGYQMSTSNENDGIEQVASTLTVRAGMKKVERREWWLRYRRGTNFATNRGDRPHSWFS
jgi:hypothetical protein